MILLQPLAEAGTAETALSRRPMQIYAGCSRVGVFALDAK